jgi:hypothetical protein
MPNLSMFLLLFLGLFGGQIAHPKHEAPDYNIRFEMSLAKSTYFVAEPIDYNSNIYVEEDKPLKAYFDIATNLAIYYRRVGKEFVDYSTHSQEALKANCLFIRPMEIKPHQKFELQGTLLYNSIKNEHLLSKPGQYEIKMTFTLQTMEGKYLHYESNTERITVLAPPSNESFALEALTDPLLARLISGDLADEEDLKIAADKLESFLDKYASSFYTPLVEKQLIFVRPVYETKMPSKLNNIYKRIKDNE